MQADLLKESENGNTERVRSILREFEVKRCLAWTNVDSERNALHLAAVHGSTGVAEILIDAARRNFTVTSYRAFLRQGDKDDNTALHLAVMGGKVAIVKLLVEADPTDRHIQNHKGKTPMYLAVENELNDIVEIISTICKAPSLDGPRGSTALRITNLEQVEGPGETFYKIMDKDALYAAAMGGDAYAIANLEMKADIMDKHKQTILHIEAKDGNTERVRFILREFANKNLLPKVSLVSEHTALHWAAAYGYTEMVGVLIDAARQHLPVTSFHDFLRQGNKDMDTALHLAVERSRMDIVKLLVEADPTDRHIQNNEGKTPMYIAAVNGLNDIAEIISSTCTAASWDGPEYGCIVVSIKNLDQAKSPGGTLYKIMDPDSIYVAAIAGDADAIAALEREADRLYRDDETILHIESRKGNTERVRFILREFANKNLLPKITVYKYTALHLAINRNHTEVAGVLIDSARQHLPVTSFQAFLRQCDRYMNTALHAAAKERNVAIVKLLVEADPNDRHIQDDDGKTPLYIAVEKGWNDIVDIISTTCTASSLDGPDCSTFLRIKNLDEAKSPGGTLYKFMDKDAIYAAAITGDADAIARLERQTDRLNFYKKTILHTESEDGNAERVRFILREFARKNLLVKLDYINQTALHRAAEHGHTQVVEVLIDAARHMPASSSSSTDNDDLVTPFQAFLRQVDEDMNTALHAAVEVGNVAITKQLVEADPGARHTPNKRGHTPIYIAVKRGYTDIVKLIDATCTAPLNLDGPGGITALHAAVQNRNHDIEVVELLIAAARLLSSASYNDDDDDDDDDKVTSFQAFIRRGDNDLDTALHIVVMQGNLATAKLLVEADPSDPRPANKEGKTPLYTAVERGYLDIVKMICTTSTAPFNLDGPGGSTALHAAVKNPNHGIEVVEVLIGAAKLLFSGSDNDNPVSPFQAFLRRGDEDLNTALHLAVMQGNLTTAKLLAEADPTDPRPANKEGKTPLYTAVERGYVDIVKLICKTCTAPFNLDGPGGSTALHAAIKNHNHGIEVVEVLICAARLLPSDLDNDCSEDDTDNDNNPVSSFQAFLRRGDEDLNTALHLAVIQGNLTTAKLLAEADPSDPRLANKEGKTPLYTAVERGYGNIVKMICTISTATFNLDGPCGSTVLHTAIKNHNLGIEVVEVLIGAARLLPSDLDNDCSEDDTDNDNKPVSSFQAFLRRGDEDLNSALHLAVIQGNLTTAKLLAEADPSDPCPENKEGKTPFYTAVERGYVDIVKMIRTTCTAPFNLDGPGGSTALHAVVKNPNHGIEVVELVIGAARLLFSNSDSDNAVSSFQDFLRRGDEDLNTALHLAVMQGNLTTAKLLVEADPSDPRPANEEGKTPFYTAVERGYGDIVKMICTTCTAHPFSLDGPRGPATALHAVIKNLDEDKNEVRDVIKMIIDAIKCAIFSENKDLDAYTVHRFFAQGLFSLTDDYKQTMLELAVERNYVDVVKLILDIENPAYKDDWIGDEFISLMPLIYKAKDKDYTNMVKLLTERYEAGAKSSINLKDQASLISAIREHNTESISSLLDGNAKGLVTFVDNLGWTALHHAVYHEFHPIIDVIVKAQENFLESFVYEKMTSTPFHVAAEKGYTSTVMHLMKSWPPRFSAYTAVDRNGKNILHMAALQSNKEMIQGILKYCPARCKEEFVNMQDNNGNTSLHLLILRGCLVPELFEYHGLDTGVRNKQNWTPPDMLYFEDQIRDDQVQIKIDFDQRLGYKTHILSSLVPPSKREKKDVIFKKHATRMMQEKNAREKEDLERYKKTRPVSNWFADAISGNDNARVALEMEADTLNEKGETILHIESMRGDAESVRYIVREFPKKNLLVKLDGLKQTALHLAAHHGHTQVVEVLIDAARYNFPSSSDSPVNSFHAFIRQATGPTGNSALHLAVLNGNVDIVKLIVDADPNDSHVKNKEGKTPIYVAAERGDKNITKEICATCTALSLDGPGDRTTALHALIQNMGQEEASDGIRMMVNAARRWSSGADFVALFSRKDKFGSTVLQLAMDRNYVDAVERILLEDPAYQPGPEFKSSGLMLLIFKVIDDKYGEVTKKKKKRKYSDDFIKLLSKTYQAGIINPDHKDVLALILAMKRRDEESVLRLLGDVKNLVTFTEDNGWTPLHYAVYHEFDSILGTIIEAQEEVGHQFAYGNMVSTPFHVAIEYGYTSTLVRLMQSWPIPSSASLAAYSPYTVVNKDDQNILHLAAAHGNSRARDDRKEMVQGILKYCPEGDKDKILKQQDNNGDTPLHLLISQGCYIPELINHKGLDTMPRNNKSFTPWDMLYSKNDVVAEQVHIKIALDDVQTKQSAWNFWAKNTEKKTDMWRSVVPPSKRRIKDVLFEESEKLLMNAKQEQRKKELERYKMRTNTQIIVAALITTVTFTVGFTMPGGLRQSGEVDEGLVLLSKQKAFNAFMVSDALALLLSTSSLFFYFLESITEDPRQVSKLNAASTVLNIVSVMAMMLTFITGTYLVLSNSPALAITICVMGSLFFFLIIILLIKIVYDRLKVKRNLD